MPLCYFLSQKFDDKLQLDYITSPGLRPLLQYVPVINNIHTLTLNSKLTNLINSYKFFSNYQTGIFINLQPTWRNNLFVKQSDYNGLYLYNKNSTTINRDEPVWQNFAKTYFFETDILHNFNLEQYFPLIKIPEQEITEFKQTHNIKSTGKPVLAIIPSVGKARLHRAWCIESWVALIQILKSSCEIVLVGGPEDELVASQITARINSQQIPLTNYVNKLTLVETAKLLKSADIAIGADTGPLHLASAVGTRTIGLFGPTSEHRHKPFGGISLRSKYSCSNQCTEKTCAETKGKNCMKHLTPLQVHKILQSELDNLPIF